MIFLIWFPAITCQEFSSYQYLTSKYTRNGDIVTRIYTIFGSICKNAGYEILHN